MKKHHYAWTICAAGTLLIFITMGAVSNAFSIYMPYIRDCFGLTNAQTSTLVTMRLIAAFACMLFIGKYYEFFEIRLGGALAAIFGGLAFLVYSFASDFALFALGAGISGLAYGFGSMVPVSILMTRWFSDHRALAISICSAGSGMGSIILPPVVTGLLSTLSMKTVFRIEAVFILCCAVIIYAIMKNYPYDMGLTRLGESHVKLKKDAAGALTPRKEKPSITNAVLIISCTGCFLMGAQGNPGIMHIPVLYTSEGFSAVFAAALMSIIGAALTAGKIVFGEITDKIGGFRSSLIFFLLLTVGNCLCSLAGLGSPALGLTAVSVLGIGYSVSTIGPSIWAGDLSPDLEYPKIMRTFQIFYSLGALVTASVPGILADHFSGSYVPAYIMFTSMSLIASLLIIAAYLKQNKIIVK